MLKLSKSEELLQRLQARATAMHHGERFPSVRQLMKEYGVSQFTIDPAMAQLEASGIIRREVGRGTFVHLPDRVVPKKIAMLFPEWPSAAIQDMARMLETAIARRNWRCHKSFYDVTSDVFSTLDKIEADAIILDPPNPGEISPRQLEYLRRSRLPVVMVRSDIPMSRINCVCGNNSAAGIIAADYLMRKGHRRLGVLFSEPHVHTGVELIESFCHAARNHGAEITLIDCETPQGEDSTESAYETMKEWLPNHPLDFSALFVSSDETVLGAYKALAENGISVPDQLSVMGFGNASPSEFYHPGLTTIDTPREQMAEAALEIVQKNMEDPDFPGVNHKVYPAIIERKSVIDKR